MAASLSSVGLKNRIKLNVLPPIENGGTPDVHYELISGHIRFAGAQKLGWQTIPAEVLTLSPEDALLEAILDNQGKPMNWLEKAEAMQSMLDSASEPSQQAVADKLGTLQKDVSQKTTILMNNGVRTTFNTLATNPNLDLNAPIFLPLLPRCSS
jgi:ParB-like chromosome segregation protein Spo0J